MNKLKHTNILTVHFSLSISCTVRVGNRQRDIPLDLQPPSSQAMAIIIVFHNLSSFTFFPIPSDSFISPKVYSKLLYIIQ